MKTTTKLKAFAVICIAFVATIAINSCSKSSSPSGPHVTGNTLGSGATITAGQSTTITITGSSFANATVSTTATGVTISNVTVNSAGTSITATISVNAATASGAITLTITTSVGSTTTTFSVTGLPLIGGYLSSDSVAASNLIAYFTFNGNVNDTVGKESGTAVGVTYVPGVRGQAYQGATGAYATVPANSAFDALQSFSVSVWYSLPQAAKPMPATKAAGIFFLAGGASDSTGNYGNELLLETDVPSATQYTNDSVPIHHGFNNIGGVAGSWTNFTLSSYDTATSTWVHVVMTYSGATSTYTFYENGQPIDAGSAYGVQTSTTIYNGPLPVGSGSPATQLMGNLNFTPEPPSTIFIGTWPPGVYGVSQTLGSAGCFLGAIDELRVFNTALTQAQVVGLYLNGLAGR